MEKSYLKDENVNYKYKKYFGQNFISDKNLIKAIVRDAKINKDDVVLEVGAGEGILTEHLAIAARKVLSYEIDDELKNVLNERLSKYNNVSLIYKDFMKISNQEIKEKTGDKFKVVANLPYYITTPIIFKLIDSSLDLESMTIMVQKEVADRLVSEKSSKSYGSITASIGIIADIKIMRVVKKQMFTPQPKIDSAIVNISINKYKYSIIDLALTRKIIKCAFNMRRKTLVNNLKKIPNINVNILLKIIEKCGFSKTVRGEDLSPCDFVKVTNLIIRMNAIN